MRATFSHSTAFVLVVVATLSCAAAAAGATPTFTLYIPTSASIHGNAGAFFHTDLWVFNRSFDSSLSVTANYRCFAGSCSNPSHTFDLAPRESKLYTDVDATFFGKAETAGAIELTYTSVSEDLVATTRTYTPSLPAPTNGTAIQGLTLAEARTRALFLGLGSNGGNLTSGFRTNAGAYNPSPFNTVVRYTLFRQDGSLIGSTTQSLVSRAAGQINDIFNAAGAGSTVTTNAVLVVTSDFPVFPFVTVIDNQSGDSVYASPSSDEPCHPVTSSVANGGFDIGLGSWTNPAPDFITMTWSPTDATGDTGSGAIVVTNFDTHPPNGSGNGPTQCVPLTPGGLANLSVRMRVPSGQSGTGVISPSLTFYGSSDCTGTRYGSIWMAGPSHFDTWELGTATGTVPANVHSGSLRLWNSRSSTAGTFTAYLDDISVVSSAR
jgi:hypothetical protein